MRSSSNSSPTPTTNVVIPSAKIIIAGGRDFDDKRQLNIAMWPWCFEDEYHMPNVEVVCGMAKGADMMGLEWAIVNWCPVKEFPANWNAHGNSAGHIRNNDMAEYADVLVAFWDGKSKGTKSMIDIALRKGLEVHVHRY
jgi:hypothetical protein